MVKVAMVQFSGSIDTRSNLRKILHFGKEAARAGAQVVCYQELATTIYFCFEENPAHFALAEPIPGPTTEQVCALAKEHHLMVILPLYEREGETLYNAAAIIGTDGRIVGKYRKNSIPLVKPKDGPVGNETFYFRPGNLGFPAFDTPFGMKIGLVICYDRHFPEGVRSVALNGAHILFVPTATFRSTFKEMWEIELRAHAFQNLMYVGGVNRVGKDIGALPDRHYFGTGLFVDPQGDVVARAGDQHDEVIYCDVDVPMIEELREAVGFFRYRRPDAYGKVCEQATAAKGLDTTTSRR